MKFVALVVFHCIIAPPRIGRNPKTGGAVRLEGKYVPFFKPGKELRDRINASLLRGQVIVQDDSEDEVE